MSLCCLLQQRLSRPSATEHSMASGFTGFASLYLVGCAQSATSALAQHAPPAGHRKGTENTGQMLHTLCKNTDGKLWNYSSRSQMAT